jgi:hypothetical protein
MALMPELCTVARGPKKIASATHHRALDVGCGVGRTTKVRRLLFDSKQTNGHLFEH